MGIDFTDVSAYLDGELDAERRDAVRKQIESSPVYAEELRRMEQAHSLLRNELDEVAYHEALMAKVQSLDTSLHRERPAVRWAFRGLAAAAAIAVMAAVADYAGIVNLGPGGGTTVTPGNGIPNAGPAANWELNIHAAAAAIIAPKVIDDATSAADTPIESLRLLGTVGGDRPAALFTDASGAYIAAAMGAPLVAGAVLADVRYGQAVVEQDGERSIIPVPESNPALALPGPWQFRFVNSDAVLLDCRISVSGENVTVSLLDGSDVSHGTLMQNASHLKLELPTDRGPLRFEGDLRADEERLYLTAVLREDGKTEVVALVGRRAE